MHTHMNNYEYNFKIDINIIDAHVKHDKFFLSHKVDVSYDAICTKAA